MSDHFHSYDVACDYGGLGNYRESDTACMLCPHEVECSHESELEQLRSARARRTGSAWRVPGRTAPTRIQPTHTSALGARPIRSNRPMPIRGESAGLRLLKNMTASALSSIGYEFGDFWSVHNFGPTIYQPDESGGEE